MTISVIPTSEGDEGPTQVPATTPHWYSEPREKRIRVRREPQRRSPRLNKEKASPVKGQTEMRKRILDTRNQIQTGYIDWGVPC